MRIDKGNVWTYPADYRVITTNGFVKENGECVMGKGVALQARQRYPDLPLTLGHCIKEKGNNVYIIHVYDITLITFPTKHFWFNKKADLKLIEKSAVQLSTLCIPLDKTVVMPPPGCGNGKLKWEQVEPILSRLLDNRFVVLL